VIEAVGIAIIAGLAAGVGAIIGYARGYFIGQRAERERRRRAIRHVELAQ
jgi:membrane protein DedA with SNARE-associated domain